MCYLGFKPQPQNQVFNTHKLSKLSDLNPSVVFEVVFTYMAPLHLSLLSPPTLGSTCQRRHPHVIHPLLFAPQTLSPLCSAVPPLPTLVSSASLSQPPPCETPSLAIRGLLLHRVQSAPPTWFELHQHAQSRGHGWGANAERVLSSSTARLLLKDVPSSAGILAAVMDPPSLLDGAEEHKASMSPSASWRRKGSLNSFAGAPSCWARRRRVEAAPRGGGLTSVSPHHQPRWHAGRSRVTTPRGSCIWSQSPSPCLGLKLQAELQGERRRPTRRRLQPWAGPRFWHWVFKIVKGKNW
jgi:hypothetical protein